MKSSLELADIFNDNNNTKFITLNAYCLWIYVKISEMPTDKVVELNTSIL